MTIRLIAAIEAALAHVWHTAFDEGASVGVQMPAGALHELKLAASEHAQALALDAAGVAVETAQTVEAVKTDAENAEHKAVDAVEDAAHDVADVATAAVQSIV